MIDLGLLLCDIAIWATCALVVFAVGWEGVVFARELLEDTD